MIRNTIEFYKALKGKNHAQHRLHIIILTLARFSMLWIIFFLFLFFFNIRICHFAFSSFYRNGTFFGALWCHHDVNFSIVDIFDRYIIDLFFPIFLSTFILSTFVRFFYRPIILPRNWNRTDITQGKKIRKMKGKKKKKN